MRRLTWPLLVLPWILALPQERGSKTDVNPPVVGPGGSKTRAEGDPVRARVLVPPPAPGAPAEEDPLRYLREQPCPVDVAWLERLDDRLEEDLHLLVRVLGGPSLGPELDRFLQTQRSLPVPQRILGKEELLRELLELAAED